MEGGNVGAISYDKPDSTSDAYASVALSILTDAGVSRTVGMTLLCPSDSFTKVRQPATVKDFWKASAIGKLPCSTCSGGNLRTARLPRTALGNPL